MTTKMTGGKISPKAILAAVLPALGGLVAVLVQWLATGAFDRAELATGISAAAAALLAFLGAWAAAPGDVTAVARDARGRFKATGTLAVAPLGLLVLARSSWSHAATMHGGVETLFLILAIVLVAAAIYLAVVVREYVGAFVCVLLAILVAVFLA